MDYREVREILEKYWQGESSLQEEGALKNFFSNATGGLPDDLQQVAGLFQFYKEAASQTAEEIPSSSRPTHKSSKTGFAMTERQFGMHAIVRLMKKYWEYAAIFLLVLCSVWLIHPVSKTMSFTSVNEDTFQDPEEAMKATQKALQIVAANLNKGKEQVQKLALFNKAEQIVKQNSKKQ